MTDTSPMRAVMPDLEPEPEPPEPAGAPELLDLSREAASLMAHCEAAMQYPNAAQDVLALVADRLGELRATLDIMDMRRDAARAVAAAAGQAGYDKRVREERAEKDARRASRAKHAAGKRGEGSWQPRLLGVVLVALWVALKHAGAMVKGAAGAHRIAAALTAVTLPAAVGAGAYITMAPGAVHAQDGSGRPAASVPGWHTSATPILSPSLAGNNRHARAAARKEKGGRRVLLSAGGSPVVGPVPGQSSPSSSASPSSSPVVSVSAGPAVLSLGGVNSLDLSGSITSATFQISASGGGWVSWSIDTTGTDLKFSPDHGVLKAGDSVTVTVSLAASLDGLAQQVFEIAGQSVTVQLPAPVPVPSAVPSAAPSVLPSVLPSVSVPASLLPG